VKLTDEAGNRKTKELSVKLKRELSKGSRRPEFPAALVSVLEAPGLSDPQRTDVARIAKALICRLNEGSGGRLKERARRTRDEGVSGSNPLGGLAGAGDLRRTGVAV
jgi:hypothetical protein